ncbi:hypothetical protein EJB05_13841, partial [Eragrostis curvula]
MAPRRHLLPPALMEELIEEMPLRFPPDNRAFLFRAALVCKDWRRLVSSPGFRRRLRELHGTPPMLGFFCKVERIPGQSENSFVPTTTSYRLPHAVIPNWRAIDTLHHADCMAFPCMDTELIVWNPIDGEVRRLPNVPLHMYRWSAALVCASTGCDHLIDCSFRPFQVVVLSMEPYDGITYAYVYSSEEHAWSEAINVQLHCGNDWFFRGPSTHVKDALYFNRELYISRVERTPTIIEFNLGNLQPSLISLPSACKGLSITIMTTKERTLGIATVLDTKLYMWSREGQDAGWSQKRVIELDQLLPVHYSLLATNQFIGLLLPQVLAVVDSIGTIFVNAVDGPFCIDLKTSMVTKLFETSDRCSVRIGGVVPYMSFCTPGPASIGADHLWVANCWCLKIVASLAGDMRQLPRPSISTRRPISSMTTEGRMQLHRLHSLPHCETKEVPRAETTLRSCW